MTLHGFKAYEKRCDLDQLTNVLQRFCHLLQNMWRKGFKEDKDLKFKLFTRGKSYSDCL